MGVFNQSQVAQLLQHAKLTETNAEGMLGGLEHDEVVLIQLLSRIEEHLVNLHSLTQVSPVNHTKADELGGAGQKLIILAKAIVSKDKQQIAKEFTLVKSLFSDYVRSVRGS